MPECGVQIASADIGVVDVNVERSHPTSDNSGIAEQARHFEKARQRSARMLGIAPTCEWLLSGVDRQPCMPLLAVLQGPWTRSIS